MKNDNKIFSEEVKKEIDEFVAEATKFFNKWLKEQQDEHKATRPDIEKLKPEKQPRNIGFKEVYNGNGILFVLSYDADTGEILDTVEIPQTPIYPWHLEPIIPIYPVPYEPSPNWWDYQFTTGNLPTNLCGIDSAGDDNLTTHTYEFQSAEDFISWLNSQE